MTRPFTLFATMLLCGLFAHVSVADEPASKKHLERITESRTFSVVQLLLKANVLKELDLDLRQEADIAELTSKRAQQWASDFAEHVGALKAGLPVEEIMKEQHEVERDRESEALTKLTHILTKEQRLDISQRMIKSGDLTAYCHPWGRDLLGLTADQQDDLRRLSSDLRSLTKRIRVREKHAAAMAAGDTKRLQQINRRVRDALIKKGVKLFEILTPEQLTKAYRLRGMLKTDETLTAFVERQAEPFRSLALDAIETHKKK